MDPPAQTSSGPLRVERRKDGRRVLLRSLTISVLEREVTVPAGYVTDYSTIPWFARWVVRWSKVDTAGTVHDYLYAVGEGRRSEADEIWRRIALSGEHGANRLQARLGWLSLRLVGWLTFGNGEGLNE